MASTLFLDIVSYSTQPMDQQSRSLTRLQGIVRETAQFQQATARGDLLSLPTGDGMALVFFHDPVAPIQCALEIAGALKNDPALPLRMGVHSGPVYRHADIRDQLNVVGGGINIAQRVMDCGDAGHILVSRSVADVLKQLSGWAGHVHDLGECQVKHGVMVHLYSVHTADAGNPAVPAKLRTRKPASRRSRIGGMAWYLLPPLAVTVLLRVFFSTSDVTRERPLTSGETLVIFVALLIVTAVILWIKRLAMKRFAK